MKHEDKKPHDKQVNTQDTGNGNPPPKKPPVAPATEEFTTLGDGSGESEDDTGNGNPPPKG